jgi:hypothetical protein
MMIAAALLSGTIAGCGTLDAIVPTSEAGSSIRIASDPPGANLYIMGKHTGTTPMVINDRDIYPVTYGADTEKLYGMVFLRKDGCEEYSRRLTRSDISNGLTAVLVCGADTTAASLEPVAPQPTEATDAPMSVPAHQPKTHTKEEGLAERRLKQLKSLQQLHDEGLISDEEENKLRRRILDAL